ncbi:SGNH/GDSL hydrolase family protein [Kriegella aquimaris]|uniref:Lysophospholipase L1 n=1 Tax=Kriegella aquimaris TaxID=192904 RepID=A0A1G9P1E3_9FLAO|nr:SGNH/GDSL hydrolase family protein [Kriegella aquimaris]SDL92480.1 Lysophospholipase L1 [Kriegella aquimaris]
MMKFLFAGFAFGFCCFQMLAQSVQNGTPLNSSEYHTLRENLNNSQLKFEHQKEGRVAFVGGSITYNPGWRDSVCAYLTQRFPKTKFEFIAAGISSMGTTPAAFRLERDVLSKGSIDLLFEEAAVNDATNGRTPDEQQRAMEGIVRHVRYQNPAVDIVIMHFVDPDKMASYRAGKEPDVITNHNLVAEHYNIPTINLAKEVTDRIDHGEFTWEDDFVDLHPSPFGQGVYARSIIQFLNKSFANDLNASDKIEPHSSPAKLDAFCYDKGHLVDVSAAKFSKGWNLEPNWSPKDGTGTRTNYTEVPMLESDKPGSTLKLKFKGKAVGIAVAAGQDAGSVEYRIDKGSWQFLDLFTQWSPSLHLPWYYTLASELDGEKHRLELRISNSKNPKSTRHACRIRYFYVNGLNE